GLVRGLARAGCAHRGLPVGRAAGGGLLRQPAGPASHRCLPDHGRLGPLVPAGLRHPAGRAAPLRAVAGRRPFGGQARRGRHQTEGRPVIAWAAVRSFLRGIPREVWLGLALVAIALLLIWRFYAWAYERGEASKAGEVAAMQALLEQAQQANAGMRSEERRVGKERHRRAAPG